MGLNVYVYRWNLQDCTNGGISSEANLLCIVNIDGPFKPNEKVPAAILTTNNVGNPVIKPAKAFEPGLSGEVVWDVAPGWFMMGGNYAASSDSRFSEAVAKFVPGFYGALPIHDRQE